MHIYKQTAAANPHARNKVSAQEAQRSANPPREPPKCDGGEKACGGFRAGILGKKRGEGRGGEERLNKDKESPWL